MGFGQNQVYRVTLMPKKVHTETKLKSDVRTSVIGQTPSYLSLAGNIQVHLYLSTLSIYVLIADFGGI